MQRWNEVDFRISGAGLASVVQAACWLFCTACQGPAFTTERSDEGSSLGPDVVSDTAVCGNGAVETGEECDPPAAGSCDSACRLVRCGNGIVEEGEGCDPPRAGLCGPSCHPEGCGDGFVGAGEECDPPGAGSCDGACRKILCGNGRLEDGEECDPPAASTCNAECRTIVCGDGRIDAGELCDPPSVGQCSATCQSIVCGDGRLDPGEQCEPAGASGASCSPECTLIDVTGLEYLYTFDSDLQGWQFYAASPERLATNTSIVHDSQNGDKSPGVLEMRLPFDGSNQKIEVQVGFSPIDMRGRTLRARVRLESGLSSDAQYPGGVKLFAKAGADYGYASGAWTYLRPGQGWADVALDCDAPVLVPNAFDAGAVRQIGIELRTFNDTQNVSAAVVYLDAVGY